jgi:hypothetical protein
MSVSHELERVATDIARRLDPVAELNRLVAVVARLEQRLDDAERERDRFEARANDAEHALHELTGDEDVLELIRDLRRGVIDAEELYDRTVGR